MVTAAKDPIPVLISLYSCEPQAVNELAKCRINPDLTSPVRTDLEFYIPQLISFYLQGYYPNMQQLVDLIVQACRNDFYFSHRIFFQLKSVTFESFTDQAKEEGQRLAVDTALKNIYEMISASIPVDGATALSDDHTERLFLPNSRDLIRLLVSFNMAQFHPQLKGCPYADALMSEEVMVGTDNEDPARRHKTGKKLARKIHQWQEQRLKNI